MTNDNLYSSHGLSSKKGLRAPYSYQLLNELRNAFKLTERYSSTRKGSEKGVAKSTLNDHLAKGEANLENHRLITNVLIQAAVPEHFAERLTQETGLNGRALITKALTCYLLEWDTMVAELNRNTLEVASARDLAMAFSRPVALDLAVRCAAWALPILLRGKSIEWKQTWLWFDFTKRVLTSRFKEHGYTYEALAEEL